MKPESLLLDGHEVLVEGTNFEPGATINVVQCPHEADSFDDCNDDSAAMVTADGLGLFDTTVFVDSSFVDGHGVRVDCGWNACAILTFSVPDSQRLHGSYPVSFDNDVDALNVTPSRDLGDGQTVTIQGRTSADSPRLVQCPYIVTDFTQCDQRTLTFPEVQSDGTFRTEMTVQAHAAFTFWGQSIVIDCATDTGWCIVAIDTGESPLMSPAAPLEFD